MRCRCRVSEDLNVESSAFNVLSFVSSSPRVRCVEASSDRICARLEGVDASIAGCVIFDLGVPGRVVLVEPVGVDALSSSVDAG